MGSIRQSVNDARRASGVQQVVCVGSSAGGLEALGALLRSLPADLPFCYLVAQHLSATRESPLPQLLARNTTLRVQFAEDGMPLAAGVVLVPHR
jgi:chemotaxis response regulator CheB